MDISSAKKIITLDPKMVETNFNTAATEFLTEVAEIEMLAREGKVFDHFAYHPSTALEIMSQIAPSPGAPFETLEIKASDEIAKTRSVVVDSTQGEAIIEAYRKITRSENTISGNIVDLNLRSNTLYCEPMRHVR